ncbi:cobalt ABC transporter, substrate-binding protein [Deferribacter desulfuricans SSM1]|uniref:Cobalt ABC transporter, substrate-binding protein n=1 Tax=Deferribacter desulfuricans (strain DSM 14783 / JCM 11476 / NBRC 101012 / SSM1) TaxID=639282 RepID=D3PAC1_DEFDS|nr:DUF4198 domain-containing protein [Deferribacter desulfuricans]BAI79544.1 cobalt ABC transporter, substrate-binding protein [Deferribacter desulfuricans SSM1]
MRLFMLLLITLFSLNVYAHFQVILPDNDIISSSKSSKVKLKYLFMHPFEQNYMNMEKPIDAGFFLNGKRYSILNNLVNVKIKSFNAWKTDYRIKRPGDYIFFVIPKPYFEPAEEKFIQHITKVTVNAFGLQNGWDKPVGLKAEIVPLTRPYGLWVGNCFRGIVLKDGKPVPNVDIEVELYNDKGVKAPSDPFITQVIKTDKNGIFTYSFPFAGWWGFSALLEGDKPIKKDGKEYPVELGAVYWLKVYEPNK